MHLRPVDYLLCFGTACVLAGVLAAMYRRKMLRLYPYFFIYAAVQVLGSPILAAMHQVSYTAYYYSYYVNLMLSVILGAAIIWNVIRRVLVKGPLQPFTSILVYLCATIILIATVSCAVNISKNPGQGAVIDMLALFNRSVRIAQILLAAAVILFARHFAISRKSFVFGLVFGFGAFALVNCLVSTGLSRHGLLSEIALSRINTSAFLFACFVWLYYSIFGTKDFRRFEGSDFGSLTRRDIQKAIMRNRWFFRIGLLQSRFGASN